MGVLACWRAVAGFKGEALSLREARGDVERGGWTSKRAENSLHSWATSGVRRAPQGIWMGWRVN